ncbi:Ankyrin repeat protein [Cucumis melo var. makuwa]|uniref:Ankyrin repeat protein n=1 Tax=Cucumis melo var. makuwa TaxID=1194695 RepID=A0A5D3D3H1_CUCMM|nr:Ankyrin repeat protein [Cucumis melo var. makuwa]TYK18184.1 Ankyrin repeat protein [Cucumis melo var. makuwa]
MATAKGFKLFQTLFLVLVCLCCVKVGATFHDVTGIFGLGINRRYSFHNTIGSSGVGMFSNTGGSTTSSVVDIESPTQAPTPDIAPAGLETNPAIKNSHDFMAFVSKDHDIHWESGRNIALSRGGVVTNGGKIGVKSNNSNFAVSRDLETSSRNNKALSSGIEIEKNNVASLGLKAHTRKVHVGVSHGGNLSIKKQSWSQSSQG